MILFYVIENRFCDRIEKRIAFYLGPTKGKVLPLL